MAPAIRPSLPLPPVWRRALRQPVGASSLAANCDSKNARRGSRFTAPATTMWRAPRCKICARRLPADCARAVRPSTASPCASATSLAACASANTRPTVAALVAAAAIRRAAPSCSHAARRSSPAANTAAAATSASITRPAAAGRAESDPPAGCVRNAGRTHNSHPSPWPKIGRGLCFLRVKRKAKRGLVHRQAMTVQFRAKSDAKDNLPSRNCEIAQNHVGDPRVGDRSIVGRMDEAPIGAEKHAATLGSVGRITVRALHQAGVQRR